MYVWIVMSNRQDITFPFIVSVCMLQNKRSGVVEQQDGIINQTTMQDFSASPGRNVVEKVRGLRFTGSWECLQGGNGLNDVTNSVNTVV
jgi:hypothetical protein